MFLQRRSKPMATAETAPKGRSQPVLALTAEHFLLSRPLHPPYPVGIAHVDFGLGCFWGAERLFWQLGGGIWITAVGYQGGFTVNPTYEEVCTGTTGHAETVRVAFDPGVVSFQTLLTTFWEAHDPTQGHRQGNDIGTQYRSTIYTSSPEQLVTATASRDAYDAALRGRGFGAITTEIRDAPPFYFAEAHHQQYLAKVPHGYCGLAGTGVTCPPPSVSLLPES